MRIILAILAVAMFIGLQGCASVTKGTKDTVYVQVSNCLEPMDCTASNKKGSWPFTAPGLVQFKKSDDDLTITCSDDGQIITERLTPTRGGMIWGNVLIGGIIGGGVDALTDAHWNMADSLILHRNNCGQDNQTSSSQSAPSSQSAAASQSAPPSQSAAPSQSPPPSQSAPSSQSATPSQSAAPSQSPPPSQSAAPSQSPPPSQSAAPSQSPPPSQKLQTSSQKVQGNQAAGKTNYIVAPRPSSLTAVDARDKDDCELIMSITKSVSGAGDSSQFVKNAKNSAITEAINNGANSYFIVSTESNLYGASVTLEALNCR